jgi:hypothetical protein
MQTQIGYSSAITTYCSGVKEILKTKKAPTIVRKRFRAEVVVSLTRGGLGSRNLDIANDVRIAALCVAGVHGRRGITVVRSIDYGRIRVGCDC